MGIRAVNHRAFLRAGLNGLFVLFPDQAQAGGSRRRADLVVRSVQLAVRRP